MNKVPVKGTSDKETNRMSQVCKFWGRLKKVNYPVVNMDKRTPPPLNKLHRK